MASTFLVRRGSDEFLLCRRAHDAGARAIRFRDTSALTFLRSCITTDRKSTRLNSSHSQISYAVFCLKKKKASVSLPDHSVSTRSSRQLDSPDIDCAIVARDSKAVLAIENSLRPTVLTTCSGHNIVLA